MGNLGINSVYTTAYQYAVKNQQTKEASGTGFLEKLNGVSKNDIVSFKDMLKSKYQGAYYNVMDTSKINGNLWGRNDYPWNVYFAEPADKSVLNWMPSGAEPSMQNPKVQAKINSMAGKMSIVIPTELEENMKDEPVLAQQVMDKIDGFVKKYYRPEANQGFLITFDESREINHACIACEGRFTVSSSEFADARKAREAKRKEYMQIIEESSLKRIEMEREQREEQNDKASQDTQRVTNAIASYEANFI